MILIKFYKTIFAFIFVLILSLTPASDIPKIQFLNIPHFDKLIHFGMYFLLSFTILTDIKNNIKKPTRLFILLVLIFIIFFSGIIEIIQANYIFGRSGSWYDLIANILGVTLGYLGFFKFVKLHQDY